jgi:hypothetical protein
MGIIGIFELHVYDVWSDLSISQLPGFGILYFGGIVPSKSAYYGLKLLN